MQIARVCPVRVNKKAMCYFGRSAMAQPSTQTRRRRDSLRENVLHCITMSLRSEKFPNPLLKDAASYAPERACGGALRSVQIRTGIGQWVPGGLVYATVILPLSTPAKFTVLFCGSKNSVTVP